ncbi:MAG: DUF4388 domain-containing protein [Nitrospirae bacterium]|nr:DUF4388 domain-containing protein [Nitrospirota bacterium]
MKGFISDGRLPYLLLNLYMKQLTGVLFFKNPSNKLYRIYIEKGEIVSLASQGEKDKAILEQFLLESGGEYSFTQQAASAVKSVLQIPPMSQILLDMGLPKEKVEARPKTDSNSRLFEAIRWELTKLIGPISSVIINDKLIEMGEIKDLFPRDRLSELFDKIIAEIPDNDRKERFKKGATEAIRKL